MKRLAKDEELLCELIRFKSTADNSGERARAREYVAEIFEEVGLHVIRINKEDTYSLIATTDGSLRQQLWLCAHIDVVDAPDASFTPIIEKDRIIGRGAIDNKFAIAAFIEAIRAIPDIHDYSFGVMLTGDEELGSPNGAEHIFSKHHIEGDVAYVPDSGESWSIETHAKGGLHIEIAVNGKAAHGSKPWLGENAIDKAMGVVDILRKENNIIVHNGDQYLPTLSIGKIVGGQATNAVAEHCMVTIDYRYITNEQKVQFISVLDEITGSGDISYTVVADVDPVTNEVTGEQFTAFKNILTKHGVRWTESQSCGATDARFFSANNIPVIVCQPNGANMHADNEWVSRSDLRTMKKVVSDMLTQFAKV